jgi:hypothetical protein
MDRARLNETAIQNLKKYAIPMQETEYNNDEYNKRFSRGTVETPIGTVKLGKNQFQKLGDKDAGKRQPLIGAMYQTLTDPAVIIREKNDAGNANVFIKSFTTEGLIKLHTIVSIVVSIENEQVAISTYKRKEREVIIKIKKADGIVYLKDDGGSPTNAGNNPRQLLLSHNSSGLSSVSE